MVGYNCTIVKHTPFATTVNANALPVQEPEPVRAGNVTCGVQQRRSACRVSAEWNCGTSVPSQCQEATPKEFPGFRTSHREGHTRARGTVKKDTMTMGPRMTNH